MADGSGDVTTLLEPYDAEVNLKTIRAGLTAKRVTAPSEEAIQTRAGYPDKLLCTFDQAPE
jgi:hypothetical protein